MNVFLDARFDALYEKHPVVLVDVGARGGLRPHWRPMHRHLRMIGFEPDPAEYSALTAGPAPEVPTTYLPTALHAASARLPLYIARDRGLTSILRPNRAFVDAFPDADRFDTIEVRHLDVEPLDAALDANGIADVDFLKVDTQGTEFFILQGAAKALAGSFVGVEIEVEFAPIYQDQPLFADVDALLRSHGFMLFDLRPVFWKRTAGRDVGGDRGQIVWADALYLKSADALIQTTAPAAHADAARAKLLKLVSVAVLYGYVDFAIDVVQRSAALLSDADTALITSCLRASPRRGERVPGQRRMAAVLRRLAARLRPDDAAWSVSVPRLGNDLRQRR